MVAFERLLSLNCGLLLRARHEKSSELDRQGGRLRCVPKTSVHLPSLQESEIKQMMSARKEVLSNSTVRRSVVILPSRLHTLRPYSCHVHNRWVTTFRGNIRPCLQGQREWVDDAVSPNRKSVRCHNLEDHSLNLFECGNPFLTSIILWARTWY
jgi:hypothetical protein